MITMASKNFRKLYTYLIFTGTWRNLIVAPANKFIKIRSDMEPNLAATLCVNPPTAYRMLKDFVTLKPGRAAFPSTHPWIEDTSINGTLSNVSIATFVYLTTSEMRTPHYSGHFNLIQWCPD